VFVAGVDGCPEGWLVVLLDVAGGTTSLRVVRTFREILSLPEAPVVIGIDIPIGLMDAAEPGGRECDRQARTLLGRPRGSSVFSPPVRAALKAKDYRAACRVNEASSRFRIRVSRQSFNLFPKLGEVDRHMGAAEGQRIFEVHPELSFFEMAGRKPMAHGKKEHDGRRDRARLLAAEGLLRKGAPVRTVRGAAIDDVLDAYAACWTARRIRDRSAVAVPEQARFDRRGIRMQILR
jgi:predicted RNase H-like nuclease